MSPSIGVNTAWRGCRPIEDATLATVQGSGRRSFSWFTGLVIIRSIASFGIGTLIALYVIDRFDAARRRVPWRWRPSCWWGHSPPCPGGWLTDRYGRWPTIRAGYTLLIPGLLVRLWAPTIASALAAAALLGVSISLPFSVQTTLGQDYLPNRIGTVSVVTLGLAIATGGVLAPAFGTVADHFSLHTALADSIVLSPIARPITRQLPEPHRAMKGWSVHAPTSLRRSSAPNWTAPSVTSTSRGGTARESRTTMVLRTTAFEDRAG